MRRADTRRSIIDAAYELFYRKGYGRVGVDEIADLAKLTKRTLYYHFRSKDELLAAMLDSQHELALARILCRPCSEHNMEHWAGTKPELSHS